MTIQPAYRNYKASGKAPISGILLLFIATTIVGVLGGLLAASIAQLVYLVIVFPIFMITVGAALVGRVGKMGKIRNRLILALFGLWIGALIYGTYWTGEYLFFVEEFYQEFRDDNYTRQDALQDVTTGLEEDTGYPHVIGYALWSIEGGLQLMSGVTEGAEAEFELNAQQTAIYYGVEALAVILVTGLMAYAFGNKPFSESCNQWYDKADAEFLGYVQREHSKDFFQSLRAGNIVQAARNINQQEGNTQVFAYTFSECNSDEVLLKAVRQERQNTVDEDGIMSKSAFTQFKSLL